MFDKISLTVSHDILFFITNCLKMPILISCVSTLIFFAIRIILHKSPFYKTKMLTFSVFSISFYISLIFQITFFMRTTKTNPFSDVFGGWTITQDLYYYNFGCVENIIMFLPLPFVLQLLYKSLNKKTNNKKYLTVVGILSFTFSLFIELLQIITELGTFQFSDIFYNTLGGLVGALLLIFIKTIYKNKKH